jgi:phage shock protein PspC (stress-responsive transcriptional regulator)
MNTEERTRSRWPLPQRSATDRKLGGVAGGLGRAWNVDPILIRVAFVVLALFGGSGVLLYCAGWLTMRGDGDDVSAIEALAGRGRSSVSPALAVVLIVVGLASMGSIFSWGIPFWPVLVGAIILTVVLSHRNRGACAHRGPGRDPSAWADDFADRVARWGADVGDRAARWGRDVGTRQGSWFGGGSATHAPGAEGHAEPGAAPGTSPRTGGHSSEAAPQTGGQSGGAAPQTNVTAPETGDFATQTAATEAPNPEDLLSDGRTPPAWDPLGAAPFAWDLPEPSPAPGGDTAADVDSNGAADRRHAPGSAIGRIFLGLALIVGAIIAAGVATGWWHLPWSAVTGITLGILAVGLGVAALRGRGGRMLIGHGVFLAVLTLVLSVSGLNGTSGYGQQTWTPNSLDAVADSYYWNAGQATLDLSGLSVPPGETVRTDVTIGGGQITVLLPADTTIDARCSVTVGQVDCLGQQGSGVRAEYQADRSGSSRHGVIDIDIHSNAGQAVAKTHE